MNYSHEDIDKMVSLNREMYRLWIDIYDHYCVVRDRCREGEYTDTQSVDLALGVRLLREKSEELRKESNKLYELFTLIVGLRRTSIAIARGDDNELTVKGQLGTGTVGLTTRINPPKYGSEAFDIMMTKLGVPVDSRMPLAVHWKRLGEWVDERLAQGKKIPVSSGAMKKVHTLTIRKKTGTPLGE